MYNLTIIMITNRPASADDSIPERIKGTIKQSRRYMPGQRQCGVRTWLLFKSWHGIEAKEAGCVIIVPKMGYRILE